MSSSAEQRRLEREKMKAEARASAAEEIARRNANQQQDASPAIAEQAPPAAPSRWSFFTPTSSPSPPTAPPPPRVPRPAPSPAATPSTAEQRRLERERVKAEARAAAAEEIARRNTNGRSHVMPTSAPRTPGEDADGYPYEDTARPLGPDIAARQPPITQSTPRTTPAAAGDGIRLLVDGVNPARLQFTVKAILKEQPQLAASYSNTATGAAAVMSEDIHPAASHNSPAGEVQDAYREPAFRALLHDFVAKEKGNYDAVDSMLCSLLGMLNSENKSRQTQARTGLLLIVDTMLTVEGNQSILLRMKDLLSDANA